MDNLDSKQAHPVSSVCVYPISNPPSLPPPNNGQHDEGLSGLMSSRCGAAVCLSRWWLGVCWINRQQRQRTTKQLSHKMPSQNHCREAASGRAQGLLATQLHDIRQYQETTINDDRLLWRFYDKNCLMLMYVYGGMFRGCNVMHRSYGNNRDSMITGYLY